MALSLSVSCLTLPLTLTRDVIRVEVGWGEVK